MKNLCLLLLSILPLISCSQSNKKEDDNRQSTLALRQENAFTTLQFELKGKPCIALINSQYKDYKDKRLFPLSLFIMINTIDQEKNGHPTEKEATVFFDLQTRIIRGLRREFPCCHVGTTTMTGYRDILLYIKNEDQKKAATILNRIKAGNARFNSYTFESDPQWEAVASFYEAVPKKN